MPAKKNTNTKTTEVSKTQKVKASKSDASKVEVVKNDEQKAEVVNNDEQKTEVVKNDEQKTEVAKSETSKKETKSKKSVAKKAVQKGGKKDVKKADKKPTDKKAKKDVKKKEPKKKATKQPKKVDDNTESSHVRYFKVVVDGKVTDARGRFSGTKPKQAANKALTSILKSREKDGQGVNGKIKFSIIECTRGSKHKQYDYVGERLQLQNPMKVTIGKGDVSKVIEYKFNNKVMKDKVVA